jgi:hypothetical protein
MQQKEDTNALTTSYLAACAAKSVYEKQADSARSLAHSLSRKNSNRKGYRNE